MMMMTTKVIALGTLISLFHVCHIHAFNSHRLDDHSIVRGHQRKMIFSPSWYGNLKSKLKSQLMPPAQRYDQQQLLETEDQKSLSGSAETANEVTEHPSRAKKANDRKTRNYKNCFLSPVQCVMKGRV